MKNDNKNIDELLEVIRTSPCPNFTDKNKCMVYNERSRLNEFFQDGTPIHTDCTCNPKHPQYYNCPKYKEAKDKIPDPILGLKFTIYPVYR